MTKICKETRAHQGLLQRHEAANSLPALKPSMTSLVDQIELLLHTDIDHHGQPNRSSILNLSCDHFNYFILA